MPVFFTNLSLMEFQVRYSVLFPLFSVIVAFTWFWIESLHKNIQLMLEFLKGLLFVLPFSNYTLRTFLVMLPIILPSILMILLSTINLIRHLTCGNNWNWPLDLNLIYKTLWTGAEIDLLISMLEKLSWFCLIVPITLVLLMQKWMGLFLKKNHLFKGPRVDFLF